MKNFMSKPITWGGYLKLCGIVTVFGIVYYGIMAVVIYWDEFCAKVKKLKEILR